MRSWKGSQNAQYRLGTLVAEQLRERGKCDSPHALEKRPKRDQRIYALFLMETERERKGKGERKKEKEKEGAEGDGKSRERETINQGRGNIR